MISSCAGGSSFRWASSTTDRNSGNFPIDPAAYYADSDVDLAMTDMFGGFPTEFYTAYRASRPEPPRWALKKQIYNLYHYLNHLNLFGNSYLSGCESAFAALENL